MIISQKSFNTNIEEPKKIDKSKNKGSQTPPKDETKVVRETTIKIKEEVTIKGNKTGNIPTNTSIFDNIQQNNSLDSVKNTLDELNGMLKTDRLRIVKKVGEFDKKVEKLNISQLVEVSKYINELMSDTDDNDDILAELNNSILDRIEEKSNESGIPFIPANLNIPNNPQSIDSSPSSIKIEGSNEELEWAEKMQEQILKGYKPTSEESIKYEQIFNKYKSIV